MRVTSVSKDYRKEDVSARYVRADYDGSFWFCEVGSDRRYDIRQGQVTIWELPETVIDAAKARLGYFPSYVEWPL